MAIGDVVTVHGCINSLKGRLTQVDADIGELVITCDLPGQTSDLNSADINFWP